mgnify:CR=1 FL=1
MATLVDNFDSYSTGDLNGQGSWSGSTNWDVQNSVSQSSPNAAACSVTGSDISKSMTATATGNEVFYIQCSTQAPGTNSSVRFNDQSSTFSFGIFMNDGGQIQGNGSGTDNLGAWSVDTWYKVEVEWRVSDTSYRARINDGAWSSWFNTATDFTTVDSTTLRSALGGAGTFYVDSFSDPNAVGPANLKTLNGIADASIKTINGIAIASVKSYDGIV